MKISAMHLAIAHHTLCASLRIVGEPFNVFTLESREETARIFQKLLFEMTLETESEVKE